MGSTSFIKEGHYTIRAHPGDVYLGFAVPKSGTGENIATAVKDYLESVGVSTADTEILGADGTTVNTRHLNGSMRNMELRLGRPLQRAVCTLHQAELPLRKMFEHLDGPTTGPRSYSGHFTPLHLADIPPLSPEVKEKMSTDAVLLHDLSRPKEDRPTQPLPLADACNTDREAALQRPAEGTTEESSDELLQRSPRQHPGWNGGM